MSQNVFISGDKYYFLGREILFSREVNIISSGGKYYFLGRETIFTSLISRVDKLKSPGLREQIGRQ
jgi:hypothetical protein